MRKTSHDKGTTLFGKSVITPRQQGKIKLKSSVNVPDSIRRYSEKLKKSLQVKQREKHKYEIELVKTFSP